MIMLVCHGISMLNFQDCNTIQEWNTRYQLSLTKPFTSWVTFRGRIFPHFSLDPRTCFWHRTRRLETA